MADIEEMKKLARQLSNPQGPQGIKVAEMMSETNIKMTKHSIDHLNIHEGDRILELGHGNCAHLPILLDNHDKVEYYGLEVSSLMYEESQLHNKKHIDSGSAFFSLYDGRKIPFKDDFFDKIFTVNTIYFWDSPVVFLNELYRVLNNEGRLNITYAEKSFMETLPFAQHDFQLYDIDILRDIIAETSFEIATYNTVSEIVKSKTGREVLRHFATISLEK